MNPGTRGFSEPRFAARFLPAAGLAGLLLAGCASAPQAEHDPGDRLESGNRKAHAFNDKLDDVVLKPVSDTYLRAVPQPVREATSRFFDNLLYVDTILNDFLQGKLLQGGSDLARFGVNSTLGVLGLFDVATPMGLPRHKEDFGQTLAVWGAGRDEYVVYPVLGPSGVRDTGGIAVSLLTNPIVYLAPPIGIPLGVMSAIDLRARREGFVKFRDQAALDPYLFTRESYRQNRIYEIHDGQPPAEPAEFFEDEAPATQPGTVADRTP